VARLELIDGRGEAVAIGRGDEGFEGAVVALGALGVVHRVTFDVVEAFRLHDVTSTVRFDEAIERLEEDVAGCDHFKLWWMAPLPDVIAFRYRRTSEAADDSAVRRWLKDRLLSVAVYRSLLAVGHLSGRRWVPAINRFLAREAGRPLQRIAPSHVGS
jgi:hypothetical protein